MKRHVERFYVLDPYLKKRTKLTRGGAVLEDWRESVTLPAARTYGIDLEAVRATLAVRPELAAHVAAFSPEGGSACPTVLLGVRVLDRPPATAFEVQTGLWPAALSWRPELVRLPLSHDSRATPAMKRLGWDTLAGKWPPLPDVLCPLPGPVAETSLREFNGAVGAALALAAARDARLAVLGRLIFVERQAAGFRFAGGWRLQGGGRFRRSALVTF